jgi:hypothetical protein
MEREKLLDIWFLFRIWAFEIIFGKIATMWDASDLKQEEMY